MKPNRMLITDTGVDIKSLYDFFESMENHDDSRVKQLLTKLEKTLKQQQTDLERKNQKKVQSARPKKI